MTDNREYINRIMNFNATVVLKNCTKPMQKFKELVAMEPKLLCYVEGMSYSSGFNSSELMIRYKNQEVKVEDITVIRQTETETVFREAVASYKRRIYLVAPKLGNLKGEIDIFQKKLISFYPHLRTFSYQYTDYSVWDIPYMVYQITFQYRIGTVMLRTMELEVGKKINALCPRLFPFEMPESVKCYIAHNYLATTIDYLNEDHGSNVERSYVQSAYGALINGQCVCQGYAEAFKRIMNKAGIRCDVVCGKILDGRDEWHAWNIVHLNNNTVHAHIDVTWDSHDRKVDTKYFAVGDSVFKNKRDWNRFYYSSCKDYNMVLAEARSFCSKNRQRLLTAGLKSEWIGL